MKSIYLIGVVSVTALLGACSSTPQAQYKEIYKEQAKQVETAIDRAPDWMSKLPKSPNAVYENGTATSIDFAMADLKAKTIAYAKICTAAGGTVRSQMKMYRNDNGDASVEQSELTVRNMCPDVDITGVETVEMKHVAEGNRIRTYVLVALPIGRSNILKSTKDAERRAPEAFKELDQMIEKKPTDSRPVSANQVQLLDVDNQEYRQRREEALKKPNAVIGQTVVR